MKLHVLVVSNEAVLATTDGEDAADHYARLVSTNCNTIQIPADPRDDDPWQEEARLSIARMDWDLVGPGVYTGYDDALDLSMVKIGGIVYNARDEYGDTVVHWYTPDLEGPLP